MKKYLLAALAASIVSSQAGVISFSSPFTTDASTGIDTANTYTHTISGGDAATVNGVAFSVLTPSSDPANFTWTTSIGTNKSSVTPSNLNEWDPAAGGVIGTEIINLLSTFTYSGTGANAGSSQTFSLLNLIIGQTYDTRLYIRPWALTGTNFRNIGLSFTHGAETNSLTFDEDRPANVILGANVNAAYYINYQFTAQDTTLNIGAAVPTGAPTDSGSFHMFGITNQVVPEPSGATLLMSLGLLGLVRRRR